MPQHLGVDGYPRSKEIDERISKDVESLFKTPNGQEVLKYLKSITVDAVSGQMPNFGIWKGNDILLLY